MSRFQVCKTIGFLLLFFFYNLAFGQCQNDTEPPQIVIIEDTLLHDVNDQLYINNADLVDSIFTLSDNCTPSDSLFFYINLGAVNPYVIGDYPLYLQIQDSSNNRTDTTLILNVVDRVAPVMIHKSDSIFYFQIGNIPDPLPLPDEILYADNYDSPQQLRDSVQLVYNDLNRNEPGIYIVEYRTKDLSNNWSNSIRFIIRIGTATLLPIEPYQVNVHPNPSFGSVQINAPQKIQLIRIYDAQGRLVEEVSPDATATKITLPSSGIFTLEIHADQVVHKKILSLR